MVTLRSRGLKQVKTVVSTAASAAAAPATLLESLEALTNESYAKQTERFFNRSYCAQDVFVGIRLPQCRSALKTHLATTPLTQVLDLIQDARHEMRMTGFIALVEAFQKPKYALPWFSSAQDDASGDNQPSVDHCKQEICRLYLTQTKYCNNWDLVDCSAHRLAGETLVQYHSSCLDAYQESNEVTDLPDWYQTLLVSSDLWETRISIVALFALTSTHPNFVYSLCLHHIERFHSAPYFRCTLKGERFESMDLIHKALGLVLRDVGKQDKAVLTAFLKAHSAKAFKTTIRHATEHLDKTKAKSYIGVAKSGSA